MFSLTEFSLRREKARNPQNQTTSAQAGPNRQKHVMPVRIKFSRIHLCCIAIVGCAVFSSATATAQATARSAAVKLVNEDHNAEPNGDSKLGYELIVNKRYLPVDFDLETLSQVWKVWPKELFEKAAKLTPPERQKMAFRRYGFSPRKDAPDKPLQFVVDQEDQLAMNCFACHGGRLYDSKDSYPGLPNNRINLETLYDDMRAIKRKLGKPFSGMDVGSALIPMGTTAGTSNAVIFGISLMAFRDRDLNLKSFVIPPYVVHHDMDAPPWWHYKKRKMLYIDGFTEKHHRALMPFIMVKQNDGKKFRGYENDFRNIQTFIESVQPPKYPHSIDQRLAESGRVLFEANCSSCHGTYGAKSTYPERVVPIEEIETDKVRFTALSKGYRNNYAKSWLTDYGKAKSLIEPEGYVAPPLDGIWATAPYFHNGSVPTLAGVLAPSQRPAIWQRAAEKLDTIAMGITFKTLTKFPKGLTAAERRLIFDTSKHGKSNGGHRFAEVLTAEQHNRIIEYLKTL